MKHSEYAEFLTVVLEEISYVSQAVSQGKVKEGTYQHGYIDGLLQVAGRVLNILARSKEDEG